MFVQFQRSRRTDEIQFSVIAALANCGQDSTLAASLTVWLATEPDPAWGGNEISNTIGDNLRRRHVVGRGTGSGVRFHPRTRNRFVRRGPGERNGSTGSH